MILTIHQIISNETSNNGLSEIRIYPQTTCPQLTSLKIFNLEIQTTSQLWTTDRNCAPNECKLYKIGMELKTAGGGRIIIKIQKFITQWLGECLLFFPMCLLFRGSTLLLPELTELEVVIMLRCGGCGQRMSLSLPPHLRVDEWACPFQTVYWSQPDRKSFNNTEEIILAHRWQWIGTTSHIFQNIIAMVLIFWWSLYTTSC